VDRNEFPSTNSDIATLPTKNLSQEVLSFSVSYSDAQIEDAPTGIAKFEKRHCQVPGWQSHIRACFLAVAAAKDLFSPNHRLVLATRRVYDGIGKVFPTSRGDLSAVFRCRLMGNLLSHLENADSVA
jgi:hypothetical protein